ncbi:MAG: PEP/pyruvate-binding domain-containing protein [Polyangia bacterium]
MTRPRIRRDAARTLPLLFLVGAFAAAACDGRKTAPVVEKCDIAAGTPAPHYLQHLGCRADFDALASEPLDSSIPGALSGKVILDQLDMRQKNGEALWFQNSVKYQIHHQFASKYLSGPQGATILPIVPVLSQFNRSEYYAADRRFILGAITYYEGPKLWTLEIAPYDTASAAMIQKLYEKVKAVAYFGRDLRFHPTSESVESVAKMLPASVKIVTTNELYAGTDYQPLNLGTAIGKLRFVTATNLETEYLNFRDIVVLDRVPNDISVVVGMITEEFQTPLAHINVLAQNRHSPNMGLRRATMNAELRALEGEWVELTVGAFAWKVRGPVSQHDADTWWETHKPKPVQVPDMDLTQTELKDITELVDESALPGNKVGLGDAIKKAILAYGGKAANYSILAKTPGVPVRKAFAIPVFYYDQFMRQNGFYVRVDALLADAQFQNEASVRDARLADLRTDMEKAPVDPAFSALLKAKLAKDFPDRTMRFRTSTNAEDQEDFLCAGCYDSHTGSPADWDVDRAQCNPSSNQGCSVLQAIRKTWSGVWYFRTFEERSYNSIDQKKIGMALLVHHNFFDEEANGVAVTANIFDPSGLEPGFYMNVQKGGNAEVVAPPPGISSDEAILYYDGSSVSITYLSHSNLVLKGTTVLTPVQILDLARALDAIQKRFSPAYGPLAGNSAFYALEVDFKFDDEDNPMPGLPPALLIKQARNYRGRGQ